MGAKLNLHKLVYIIVRARSPRQLGVVYLKDRVGVLIHGVSLGKPLNTKWGTYLVGLLQFP